MRRHHSAKKSTTFPTDAKQYRKIHNHLLKLARAEDINLPRTHEKEVKQLKQNTRLAHHPRNRKKARHAVKRLKTIAGRLLREIQRQMNGLQQQKYHKTLSHYQHVLKQKRGDKNKIYSLHEPHIYCMSKGKDHKKYEFGTKASVAKTRIHIPKPPRKNASKVTQDEMRKCFQRRAEIEPVIGHLKSDHRLNRSFLKGFTADQINLLMATSAFNFKKWMREVYFGLRISGSYLHG